MQPQVIHSASK